MAYNSAASQRGRNERIEGQAIERLCEMMVSESKGRSNIKQSHKLKEKEKTKQMSTNRDKMCERETDEGKEEK